MDSTPMHLRKFLGAAAALLAALSTLPATAVNHETTVAPISAGRFKVACSNVAQDTSRMIPGAIATDYWEGKVVDGRARYITEILSSPQAAIVVDALVPDIRTIYPGNAGDVVQFAGIVCHPTPANNPDPDYVLPATGEKIPHMLPAGSAPRLLKIVDYLAAYNIFVTPPPADVPMKLPMIVYSHGLSGSPIGKGYVDVMVQLASQGFVVAAVFHGDARFSRVRLEDFSDYYYALTQFDRIAEMMLLRPVSLKAMTDRMLADPGYRAAIDPDRIGGFGASMGGQAMAHLLGAKITTSIGLACRETVRDPRIRAAVGYVPYSGQSWLPAFCDDQAGADLVTKPYLAITGSADTTAPQKLTEQAVNRFKGTRYLVSLKDGEHELRAEDAGDLMTWMVTFFNAYLDVSAEGGAMARLIKMNRVTGGREDSMVVDVHVPTTFNDSVNEGPAREFYNVDLRHYFLAGWQGEVDIILAGGAGKGWELTGQAFKIVRQIPPVAFMNITPVCRFYGVPAGGPNSHLFIASQDTCDVVKRMGGWFYEGIGFYAAPLTTTGRCPAGQLEVMRAYNNRWMQNDSNHRYSTSDSTMREMARLNWVVEGTAWCAQP